MSKLGQLTEWNDDRGFGFISPQNGGPRVFVHVKTFRSLGRRPKPGEWLRFVEGRDPKGRPRADSATFVSVKSRGSTGARPKQSGLMIVGILTLLAVVGMMLIGILPDYLAYLIIGMSVISFVLYAMDKNAAEKRRWRTSENTFHLLSLLGGWPGALIAQQGFRHKNRKRSFQMVFWLTVFGNVVLVWFLVAESGMGRLL